MGKRTPEFAKTELAVAINLVKTQVKRGCTGSKQYRTVDRILELLDSVAFYLKTIDAICLCNGQCETCVAEKIAKLADVVFAMRLVKEKIAKLEQDLEALGQRIGRAPEPIDK